MEGILWVIAMCLGIVAGFGGYYGSFDFFLTIFSRRQIKAKGDSDHWDFMTLAEILAVMCGIAAWMLVTFILNLIFGLIK